MQSKVILENLKLVCPSSNLHLDSLFEQCLQGEMVAYWAGKTNDNAFVTFKINESGDLVFLGIKENVTDLTLMAFPIENPKLVEKKLEEAKLADKKKVDESLKEMSQVALENKKHQLLDYLLKQKSNESI